MRQALSLAAFAASTSADVPVGAVIIDESGNVIAQAANMREAQHDPTAHAEVLAIRWAAERLGTWRLDKATLVVTLEPCVMCAGAIVLSRLSRVVFGAWDPKAGAAGSVFDVLRDRRLNHRPEVITGVREDECGQILRTFFAERRSE
ncbi:tRNA-specific adenosine deaminase [mine drainage metagenome]|uniref:tRNA-specific adenosine deaminase 2 n=1 Tax=mine drainage metagenome TaxID=410659 RepID=A0A1J5NWK8_9ZZZZ